MLNMMKARLSVAAAALLLMGGLALASAPHRAAAQGPASSPTAMDQCNQDAVDSTKPAETVDPTETGPQAGNVDVQCGDQNAPDANGDKVDASDNATDGDNVQQQDGLQNQNDDQPETPDVSAQ